MAVIKKDGGYMPLPISIKRGNAIPLDMTSVWYDADAMSMYAKADTSAYVGQILAHVDENANSTKIYVIANTAGDLTPIGEETGSSVLNVDNNTIELNTEGLLKLKDFGSRYYRYVAAQKNEQGEEIVAASYVLQEVNEDYPWRAGLVPQVIVNPDDPTNFIIGWYEPNPTTIEGVNTAVSALQNELIAVKANLSQNYYTKTELAGVLTYKGAKNTVADIKAIIDANIGDVYVAKDTNIEYVWNGSQWDALGETTNLSNYVTKTEIGTLITDIETLQTDAIELKRVQANLLSTAETITTKVDNLETLIGAPETEDTEASGLHAVIANEIANANYLIGVQVDGSDLAISQRKAQLTTFTKNSNVAGLVPAAAIELNDKEKKSDYFLNAEGSWAIPSDPRVGDLTYKNVTYNDVTSYVDARVQNVAIQWESLS